MGGAGGKEQIPIEPAFEVGMKLLKNPNIVSVGSGFGVTEAQLEKRYKCTIITVDPLNEEFEKPEDPNQSVKPPMVPNCEEYRKAYPTSNLLMILDWPSPNDATYGIKAIELLQPEVLVIRYASCGAAGSTALHFFLSTCDCPHSHVVIMLAEAQMKSTMDGRYHLKYMQENPVEGTVDIVKFTTVTLQLNTK